MRARPSSCRVPPLRVSTPEPRAVLLPTIRLPTLPLTPTVAPLTVTPPLKVLLPLSSRAPVFVLVSCPGPLTG